MDPILTQKSWKACIAGGLAAASAKDLGRRRQPAVQARASGHVGRIWDLGISTAFAFSCSLTASTSQLSLA